MRKNKKKAYWTWKYVAECHIGKQEKPEAHFLRCDSAERKKARSSFVITSCSSMDDSNISGVLEPPGHLLVLLLTPFSQY